jgi:hypothetical protein
VSTHISCLRCSGGLQANVVSVEPVARDLIIDRSIPELSVAKAHLASTLSGGLYPKAAAPAEVEGEFIRSRDSESETHSDGERGTT